MLEWLQDNVTLVQVGVAFISAIVWLVYLQLFLSSFIRQRRPQILISRGPGVGLEARCFIANLGFEPIYVSQLLMSVWTGDEWVDAAITDREVMTEEDMRDVKQATNQGPLKSGDSYDAGSFRDLIRRTFAARGRDEDSPVKCFNLTVVALHSARSAFIGAVRHYDVRQREDYLDIVPDTLETQQIRTMRARRRLRAKLERDLSWYRS